MEDSYFLILADQNLHPLKSKLKTWDAFFTGIGYAIPYKYKEEAAAFCKKAELKIYKQPLPQGATFASFEQSHKTAYLQDRLMLLKNEISILSKTLGIDVENPNHLKELPNLFESERILKLLEDEKELTVKLKKSESFEKALSSVLKETPQIRFISEQPTNLLLEDPPEIPRLVNFWDGSIQRPFLRKGILAMLVGAGGVGKTCALTQLALSIATGYPWFGIFPIEKQGHVFLGLGENKDEDIHRLLRKAAKHLINISSPENEQKYFFQKDPLKEAAERIAPMSFSGINATFIQQGEPTHYFESLAYSLSKAEPPDGWSCIILDPISRFIGTDAETDNASATQFIALLEKLSIDLKGHPTIIFGHHMNKGGVSSQSTNQSAARGSSAITDGVRWQVNLERSSQEENGEKYIFRHVKSNFTPILGKYILEKDLMGYFYHINEQKTTKQKENKNRYIKIGEISRKNEEYQEN